MIYNIVGPYNLIFISYKSIWTATYFKNVYSNSTKHKKDYFW